MRNTKKNTPEHCHTCKKFQECYKAQHMMSNTEAVDAYWEDCQNSAAFVCENCLRRKNGKFTSITNEEVQNRFIGNTGETDCPDHCSHCGRPLKCSLTMDGMQYVKDTETGCCMELWPILYDYAINA